MSITHSIVVGIVAENWLEHSIEFGIVVENSLRYSIMVGFDTLKWLALIYGFRDFDADFTPVQLRFTKINGFETGMKH